MSSEPSSAQKAKLFALLQFIVPATTLIFAAIIWFIIQDDIIAYVCAGLVVLAAIEFFMLRHLADRAERQAERDRG